MLQKITLASFLTLLLVALNLPTNTWIQLAQWSQGYWGSILSLGLAMLTLIPALLTLGTGPAELISASAFALFFWGRYQETHSLLPLALFGASLAFFALEILVLPGIGKAFVLGAAALSAAIWKAYPDHQMGMQALLFSYMALGAGLFFTLRVLPRSRITARLMALKPPDPETSRFDPAAELKTLIGQTGIASTVLQPSGKADIANQSYGVRSQSGFIKAGTRVRVVAVESNQLIVQAD